MPFIGRTLRVGGSVTVLVLAVVTVIVMAGPILRDPSSQPAADLSDSAVSQSGPSSAPSPGSSPNASGAVGKEPSAIQSDVPGRTTHVPSPMPIDPSTNDLASAARETPTASRKKTFAPSQRPTPSPTPSPSPTRRPAPTANPRPTVTPVVQQTRPATPKPTPSREQLERQLLREASEWDCERFRGSGNYDPFEYEAQAAISCDDPAKGIKELALFRFPDRQSLADYFAHRVENTDEWLVDWDGACVDGANGVREWAHGSLACWVASTGSKTARLRWTDERGRTYGVLDGDTKEVDRLYRWWKKNMR